MGIEVKHSSGDLRRPRESRWEGVLNAIICGTFGALAVTGAFALGMRLQKDLERDKFEIEAVTHHAATWQVSESGERVLVWNDATGAD